MPEKLSRVGMAARPVGKSPCGRCDKFHPEPCAKRPLGAKPCKRCGKFHDGMYGAKKHECKKQVKCATCNAYHPNRKTCVQCQFCTIVKHPEKPVFHKLVALCKVCSKCRISCGCRKRVKPLNRPLPLSTAGAVAYENSFRLLPIKRWFAVELEVANNVSKLTQSINNDTFMDGRWTQARDGSVTGGFEMVSSLLGGDQGLGWLTRVLTHMRRTDASVDNTCGFHVHVDVRDLSYFELAKVLRLYLTIEQDIYAHLVEGSRSTNKYSFPYFKLAEEIQSLFRRAAWANTNDKAREAFIRALYHPSFHLKSNDPRKKKKYTRLDESVAVRKNGKYGVPFSDVVPEASYQIPSGSRYLGLNLHSVFYRGTVEFRMKEGVTTSPELVYWPLFCLWLVQIAINMPMSVLDKASGLWDVVHLFPPYLQKWLRFKSNN